MDKRAQIAPIILIVTAILIFAYAATMIIGELGFQRIRIANVVDGSLITATSRLCQAFNKIRPLHNQMFLNSIRTQASIGVRIYTDPGTGYAATYAMALPTIIQNRSLFKQANQIANDASDSLRVTVADAVFAGALVDEPKPFEQSEVVKDPKTGEITGFDYEVYNKRESDFMILWKEFKNGTGEFTNRSLHKKDRVGPAKGGKGWHSNNTITYYYNKSKEGVLARKGKLVLEGERAPTGYEAYVQLKFENFPRKVSVTSTKFTYIFIFCTPCCVPPGCCFWPGFVYNHWAWLKRVNIDKKVFSVVVTKSISGGRVPLFKRQGDVVLQHVAKVRLTGSLWSGYDFRLEPVRQ